MADIWATAGAEIASAFADPEPVTYASADAGTVTVSAIDRSEPQMTGPDKLIYEIAASALPGRPTKRDTFVHRGRAWRVDDVPQRPNAAGGWELAVVDDGAAT